MLTVLALALAYLICRFVVKSKLGRVATAIRDAESRVRFLGYRTDKFKLFLWTLSAMLAGMAGALYVPQVGIINPGEFSPANSIEVAVWVAVGGRGTLFGAILGAFTVNGAKSFFTGWAPDALVEAISAFSFLGNFNDIMRGVIDFGNAIYFATLIAFWLFANAVVLDAVKSA